MKRDIHILMHTHWDREWYFSKDETHVLLIHDMIEVIHFLEKHADAYYVLDGQAVMLDDFLKFAPHYETRLKALVQQGRLKIGPWYTQTDLRLVYGESVVRNLYYGMKRCLTFGDVMRVGYAPDTFGHASQMPQIYRLFGIESTFFWRGLSTLKANQSDFKWRGVDGSWVYGINLATGYQGAKYLETDEEGLHKRMAKIMPVLDKFSATKARLIMNGHDQMPIQTSIYEVIEHMKHFDQDANICISTFENYVDALRLANLIEVEGELVDSQHARIHRTISSTRMDIKILVRQIEQDVYHVLEPLSLIGKTIGIEYPHALIEHVLKVLFGVHAHDSMGGCNGDYVNQDIKQRLLNIQELVHYQIALTKRLITEASGIERAITITNVLPFKQTSQIVEVEVQSWEKDITIYDQKGQVVPHLLVKQTHVDAGLIDRQVAARLEDKWVYISTIRFQVPEIDGLSVLYYHFEEQGSPVIWQHTQVIENDVYQITCENNQLQLLIKETGEVIENMLVIENGCDAGDSYDYSPPVEDVVIIKPKEIIVLDQKIMLYTHLMNVQMVYHIPADESSRLTQTNMKEVVFDVELMLSQGSNLIDIKVQHTNVVKDSRYRLVVAHHVQTNHALSDSLLSTVTKPLVNERPLNHWIQDGWVEKPVSIEPFQTFVQVSNKQHHLTVYSQDIGEYECIGHAMYLTLFRSFSHLGKSHLVNRPGRPSGIMLDTPDHQLIDETFNWHLAINYLEDQNPACTARTWSTPLQSDAKAYFHRFNINQPLTKHVSHHLNLDLNGACLVACKLNDDHQCLIRVYNPTNHDIVIQTSNTLYEATVFEQAVGEVVEVCMKPQEIKTMIVGGSYERL